MDSAQMNIKATASVFDAMVQEQLAARLETLRRVSSENGNTSEFGQFLEEVDAALKKFEDGTYGICEECHESMGAERMLTDPLARICLDELSEQKKRSLEDDLQFASEIQRGLLPQKDGSQKHPPLQRSRSTPMRVKQQVQYLTQNRRSSGSWLNCVRDVGSSQFPSTIRYMNCYLKHSSAYGQNCSRSVVW